MTITEDIYRELVEGLGNHADWQQFLAKHSNSKGPLYNALAKVLSEIPARLTALSETIEQRQAQLDDVGRQLDDSDQKMKTTDKALQAKHEDLIRLEEKANALKKRIELLDKQLKQRTSFSERLRELEKLGFDENRLTTLHAKLVEMGAKRGLKPSEATKRFFADLKDYDAVQGFAQEAERLKTIIKTKTLEAQKWQAELDGLVRRHADLSDTIAVIQGLANDGVRTEEIKAWSQIVNKLGGLRDFQRQLEQYGSMSALVTARKKDLEGCNKKLAELEGQVSTLDEQKAKIEGAIAALSASGVKQITTVGSKALGELESLSTSGIDEITKTGDKITTSLDRLCSTGAQRISTIGDMAVAELKALLAETRVETKRLSDLKAESGKFEKELMCARYFTTGDSAVIKSLPSEVVSGFVDRAASYCRLNNLDYKVRMPDRIYDKYYSKNSAITWAHPEVSLLDLASWLQVGLAGAG